MSPEGMEEIRAANLISDPVCPRCGYSLRGVAQWTDACPLTGTCSECGLEVEWRRAFTILPHPWLFERLWRTRPARSFVATASRTLRPWRLWKEVDLSEPFMPGPALAFNLLLCLLILLGETCIMTLAGWVKYTVFDSTVSGPLTIQMLADAVLTALRRVSMLGGVMVLWSVVHAVSLLMPQTSVRRSHVLPVHLIRIALYSSPFMMLGWFACFMSLFVVAIVLIWLNSLYFSPVITIPIEIAALVSLPFSIILYYRWALRDYLKLPHTWGVSILLTLLAGLVTLGLIAAVTVPMGYTDWVTWF